MIGGATPLLIGCGGGNVDPVGGGGSGGGGGVGGSSSNGKLSALGPFDNLPPPG
jgi:hypothetical protein